jgi:transcription termination factor NusB
MGVRRRAREAALQILYCVDLAGHTIERAERLHWEHLASSIEGRDFAHLIVAGYQAHAEAIDARHFDVEKHEIGPKLTDCVDRLGAVRAFADDLDVVMAGQ